MGFTCGFAATGGLVTSTLSAEFGVSEDTIRRDLREMARAAAGLIEGGQVVLVDGGSTHLVIARQVSLDLQAMTLTSSPAVALAPSEDERLEVVPLWGPNDSAERHRRRTRGTGRDSGGLG